MYLSGEQGFLSILFTISLGTYSWNVTSTNKICVVKYLQAHILFYLSDRSSYYSKFMCNLFFLLLDAILILSMS